MARVYYKHGRYEVTDKIVRLPRASHDVQKLQSVSVRFTPLYVIGGPSLGVLGFTALTYRYLSAEEVAVLVGGAAIALAISLMIGTLHLESVALRDGEIGSSFGPIHRLNKVRRAIEQSMADR